MGRACAWENRWYKGLNSHSPLSEDVKNLFVSKEELMDRMAEKKEKDRIRARVFYWSKEGQLYHQAYRNTAERKAYMKAYQQSPENKRRMLASPGYAKQLQERKDGRVLVKKFEAKQLSASADDVITIDDTEDEDDTDQQKLLGKALKLKASKNKTRAKHRDRDAEQRHADHEVYKQAKSGGLDQKAAKDPKIAHQVKVAGDRVERSRVYKATHRPSVNATKKSRYRASVEAIEKVANGSLDGNDPEVQKLCRVAESARERARKNQKK